MFCENEYALFCRTWERMHVPVTRISAEDLTEPIRPRTLYKFRDNMRSSFLLFANPDNAADIVLIGPYARDTLSPEAMLELAEQSGIDPKNRQGLSDYLSSIPVVPENSPLFYLLDSFCERMWEGQYETFDSRSSLLTGEADTPPYELEDTVLTVKNMERRYEMEKDMMRTVMQGAEHRIAPLFSRFSETMFERRNTDPLRNSKNYCIITNTLLRKAAEEGGVHPVYLDRISSQYALRIEQIPSVGHIRDFLLDMFKSYCRLVREANTADYSPLVRTAVAVIRTDPAAPLTLHQLAARLHVSNAHLSDVFRRETGKTVTAFIRDTRMTLAMRLLRSTTLQIQTVALHCGIVDVQYFSKLFKAHTGLTPTQFRQQPEKTH